MAAGFETTVNLIGKGIVWLFRHPEQLERLQAEPELCSDLFQPQAWQRRVVQRAGAAQARERVALDIAHAEKRPPVDFAALINRHDARMIEAGHRLHFVAERGAVPGIAGALAGHDLDRHRHPLGGVNAAPDLGHAAPADAFVHAISIVVLLHARSVARSRATQKSASAPGLGHGLD